VSTLGSILGVARGAVLAQQSALQVTSNNVANAETPGYTRQRATLTAAHSVLMPNGSFGTGVLVTDVQRVRDTLLDASYRRQSASAAGATVRHDALTQVESVFNEPADGAIGSALDKFWDSWSDLANAPTDSSARAIVVQRGQQLTQAFANTDTGLLSVAADTQTRLGSDVGQVNAIAKQIAALNVSIVSAEVGGHQAGDLRDQRDLQLDALSKLATTTVDERADGSIGVHVGTTTLVDGSSYNQLELRGPTTVQRRDPDRRLYNAPQWDVAVAGSSTTLRDAGGTIGAAITVLNTDIPAARQTVQVTLESVYDSVDGPYALGYSATYEAANPSEADWTNADPSRQGSRASFFEGANGVLTPSSMMVRISGDDLATGYSRYATGDNRLALDIAGLRTATGKVGTKSIGDYYRASISSLASSTADAASTADASGALATQADTQRQSVIGVSTDEELIQLMKHQQAYAAAAKVVTAVDEMMQTLLGMK